MHDQLAGLVDLVMLVEEGQNLVCRRENRFPKERSVERVLVPVQHHENELRTRHPFPLVPPAFLQLIGSLFERCPAVRVAEHVAPEIDTFRDENAIVSQIQDSCEVQLQKMGYQVIPPTPEEQAPQQEK